MFIRTMQAIIAQLIACARRKGEATGGNLYSYKGWDLKVTSALPNYEMRFPGYQNIVPQD